MINQSTVTLSTATYERLTDELQLNKEKLSRAEQTITELVELLGRDRKELMILRQQAYRATVAASMYQAVDSIYPAQ